jgi:hypothetical protein
MAIYQRSSFDPLPSRLDRLLSALPGGLGDFMQRLLERQIYSNVNGYNGDGGRQRVPQMWPQLKHYFNPRGLLALPNLCILLWLLVLLWGERWVFESGVRACEWGKWERWVGCPWIL